MKCLTTAFIWLKSLFHFHDWYGMTFKEWQSMNQGSNYICTKCGERRNWCDT